MNGLSSAAADWSDTLIASLWQASWQGGVALAIALVLTRLWASLSPRLACWIWRLAGAKMLVALLLLAPLAIPLLPARTLREAPTEFVPLRAEQGAPPSISQVEEQSTPLVYSNVSTGRPLTFWELLTALWLVGVCCGIFHTARQWMAVARRRRLGRSADSSMLRRICREEAQALHVACLPQLLLGDGSASPHLMGIWRPAIYLPADWQEVYTEAELRIILGHELAHLKRRDLLWNWLPTIVGWLFFFHPLVWLMKRCWEESQEAACDELLVVRQNVSPSQYGRLLLKLSIRPPQKPFLATAGVAGSYRLLERRILAMTRMRNFSRRSMILAGASLAALGAISMVPWRLVEAEAIPPDSWGNSGFVQAQTGPGRILVWRTTKFVYVTPDGKVVGECPIMSLADIAHSFRLSPDGKRVAFAVKDDGPRDEINHHPHRHILVCPADGKTQGKKIDVNAFNLCWTPDGKQLLAFELISAKEPENSKFLAWLVDADSGEKTALNVPPLTYVLEMTPDGKTLVGVTYDLVARAAYLALISRDGTKLRKLTRLNCEGPAPRVSPDGSKILFQDFDPDEKPEAGMPRLLRLHVYDLNANKRTSLESMPLNGQFFGYAWSPDGKQLALSWKRVEPEAPLAENVKNMDDPKINTETESHLVITDADGKNSKVLISEKAPKSTTITLGPLDWR